jgi:hypothetical protein
MRRENRMTMTGAVNTGLVATCQCGQTAIEVVGAPILCASCYCESCRTAGQAFGRAPGAPPVVRPDGGTDYCLFRKDRVRLARGGAHLEARRLAAASPTRRVVAMCCNTPMFLDFTKGSWLTIYRDRFGERAPPLQMRVMTEDAPDGFSPAGDLPSYRTRPARFMLKLLGAWAAMGFRRPDIGC